MSVHILNNRLNLLTSVIKVSEFLKIGLLYSLVQLKNKL